VAAPRGGVIYRSCDFFFFFFLGIAPRPYRLTDFRAQMLKRRGVAHTGAFWGLNLKFLKFGGVLPQKCPKRGVVRHFQCK